MATRLSPPQLSVLAHDLSARRTSSPPQGETRERIFLIPCCRPPLSPSHRGLDSVPPPAPRDELKHLCEKIAGKARLLGLGEASHGASEQIRWKHEIIEILAEDATLTLIIFEIPFGSCQAINRYIVSGAGTALDAVLSNPYDLFHTDEMVGFVEMLHLINRRRAAISPSMPKIRLVGYDTTFPAIAFNSLSDGLDRAGLTHEVAASIARLRAVFQRSLQEPLLLRRDSRTLNLFRDLATIEEFFAPLLPEGVAGYPITLWIAALRAGLERLCVAGDESINTAERLNATIILSLLSLLSPNERAVLWAHDFHIGRWQNVRLSASQTTPYTSLGHYLAQELKGQYRNLGFEMLSGTVGPTSRGHVGYALTLPPSTLAQLIASSAGLDPSSPSGCVIFSSQGTRASRRSDLSEELSKTIHCFGPPTPPYPAQGCVESYDTILLCPQVSPTQFL